jgi:hypothetical protein
LWRAILKLKKNLALEMKKNIFRNNVW